MTLLLSCCKTPYLLSMESSLRLKSCLEVYTLRLKFVQLYCPKGEFLMFRYCTLGAIFVQYTINISLLYIGLKPDFPGAHSVKTKSPPRKSKGANGGLGGLGCGCSALLQKFKVFNLCVSHVAPSVATSNQSLIDGLLCAIKVEPSKNTTILL
jgi:hypothetical protein